MEVGGELGSSLQVEEAARRHAVQEHHCRAPLLLAHEAANAGRFEPTPRRTVLLDNLGDFLAHGRIVSPPSRRSGRRALLKAAGPGR